MDAGTTLCAKTVKIKGPAATIFAFYLIWSRNLRSTICGTLHAKWVSREKLYFWSHYIAMWQILVIHLMIQIDNNWKQVALQSIKSVAAWKPFLGISFPATLLDKVAHQKILMLPNPLAARCQKLPEATEAGNLALTRSENTVGDQPGTGDMDITILWYSGKSFNCQETKQLKSFRIKMDILKFFLIILPFASTMTLPEQSEFDNSIF